METRDSATDTKQDKDPLSTPPVGTTTDPPPAVAASSTAGTDDAEIQVHQFQEDTRGGSTLNSPKEHDAEQRIDPRPAPERTPVELINRIRDAFLSEKFSSVTKIAAHFGVSVSTVWRYHDEENWTRLREGVRERRRRDAVKRIGAAGGEVDSEFFEMWNLVKSEVIKIFRDYRRQDQTMPISVLEKVSRVIASAQVGQGLATKDRKEFAQMVDLAGQIAENLKNRTKASLASVHQRDYTRVINGVPLPLASVMGDGGPKNGANGAHKNGQQHESDESCP